MNLKKHFTFKGRLSRMKYFLYQIIVCTTLAITKYVNSKGNLIVSSICLLVALSFGAFLICKVVQRLHDINLHGATYLIFQSFIFIAGYYQSPILMLIPLFIHLFLFLKKGTIGPNKYGDDPLGTSTETEISINEVE